MWHEFAVWSATHRCVGSKAGWPDPAWQDMARRGKARQARQGAAGHGSYGRARLVPEWQGKVLLAGRVSDGRGRGRAWQGRCVLVMLGVAGQVLARQARFGYASLGKATPVLARLAGRGRHGDSGQGSACLWLGQAGTASLVMVAQAVAGYGKAGVASSGRACLGRARQGRCGVVRHGRAWRGRVTQVSPG